MDAKKIWNSLSDDEIDAINAGREEFSEILNGARKVTEIVPADLREKVEDAIEDAIMGGEANGFCAGFYYAAKMFEGVHFGAMLYFRKGGTAE